MLQSAHVGLSRRRSWAALAPTSAGNVGPLAVVLLPAIVATAICLYQIHLPHVLYGTHDYGEGVYMGAALHLLHGVMPYRDYVFVHPPGIALLMTPVAALAGKYGTYTSLALGRDLTILVTAANASLAALIVRHRGMAASLIAGTALACFPLAPAADSAVLLETYLVFFCLLGLLLMFKSGQLAPPPRVLLAGIAFGFAGAVKIWAFLILASAVAVAAVHLRRVPWRLVGGAGAGFLVPTLPFFALAPGAFIREVVVVQAGRVADGTTAASISDRLTAITGVAGLGSDATSTAVGVAVGVVLVSLVGGTFLLTRRSMKPADWALLLCGGTSVAALLRASCCFVHYVYFTAAFMAMLLGICAARLAQRFAPTSISAHPRRKSLSLAILGTAMVSLLAPVQAAYAQTWLSGAINPMPLNLFIPPGACVIADYPSNLIAADLYESGRPGCPNIVDPYGTWLTYGPRHAPPYAGPYPAEFVDKWQQWLEASDYVVTHGRYSILIPWTPALRAWFNRTFYFINDQGGFYVYCHAVAGSSLGHPSGRVIDPCAFTQSARHES